MLQFTNEQCLQKGNRRRITLTLSLLEILCRIPLLGAGGWTVRNHRVWISRLWVMLVGGKKASYLNSYKIASDCHCIVLLLLYILVLHHSKLCSILCGFVTEEACYGSIIMSSPWHRGKDLRREWSDPEVSHNLFYPLQADDFTSLYLLVDRIE